MLCVPAAFANDLHNDDDEDDHTDDDDNLDGAVDTDDNVSCTLQNLQSRTSGGSAGE